MLDMAEAASLCEGTGVEFMFASVVFNSNV